MKKILLLSSFFFASVSFAQLENANWCFGINARVNFNPLPPSSTLASAIGWGNPGSSVRGSSVSNNTGQLLFYTDGINIWNGSNQQILNGANGNGIYGWSSIGVQNSVIVPKPGYPNLYYVFTLGSMGIVDLGDMPLGRGGIHYSVVDMSNGTGQVVPGLKNISIKDHNGVPIDYAFDYAHTEDNPVFLDMRSRMTTTIHADGEKIWVSIIPDFYFNHQHTRYFYNFLVTKDGINGLADGISPQPYVSSLLPASNYGTNWLWSCGSMKISPNGQFMCDAEEIVVNLYNYNNTNGTITLPPTTVFNPGWNGYHSVGFGIEFSPDSKLVYFTDNPYGFLQSGFSGGGSINIKDHASLYQYDIQSQRLRIIYDYPTLASDIITPLPVEGPFGIQLGIDNKIYVCAYGHLQEFRDNLGVINNPNVLGTGCNFVPDGFQLFVNTFQNGFLPQWVHKASVCTTSTVVGVADNATQISGPDLFPYTIVQNNMNVICYRWEWDDRIKLKSTFSSGNTWYFNNYQIPTSYTGYQDEYLTLARCPNQNIPQFCQGSWDVNPIEIKVSNPNSCNGMSTPIYLVFNPLYLSVHDIIGVHPGQTSTVDLFNYGTNSNYTWHNNYPGVTITPINANWSKVSIFIPISYANTILNFPIDINNQWCNNGTYNNTSASCLNYCLNSFIGKIYVWSNIVSPSSNNVLTQIYPNPANNKITITSTESINYIEISDLMNPSAKRIRADGSKLININISDLKPGVYNCRIITSEGTENQKVIINR